MKEDIKLISFVIPCYRSEHTVTSVVEEIIKTVASRPQFDYEIIAVNDCSPDRVVDVLVDLSKKNERVKVIDCSINRGKHAAVLAGYAFVQGEYVVNIDDDGQCPVDRLWDLIAPLEQGYDMSMAKYETPKESFMKRIGSIINNKMSQSMLDKPNDFKFSNFLARKKFVCDAMCQYKGPYPYLEGLSLIVTRNVCMVPMEERHRLAGTSGYTFKKSLALWMNGYTAFSLKPLRISFGVGCVFGLIGLLHLIISIVLGAACPGFSAWDKILLSIILLAIAFTMILLGMIGEYVGRIYLSMNNQNQYVIRATYNIGAKRCHKSDDVMQ